MFGAFILSIGNVGYQSGAGVRAGGCVAGTGVHMFALKGRVGSTEPIFEEVLQAFRL